MPLYRSHCPLCGAVRDDYRPVADYDRRPHCCGQPMDGVISAPMIIGDIEPYRAVAVDIATGRAPVIGSRRQHREFLRRNGYVEVGDGALPPKSFEPPGSCRAELTRALQQTLNRQVIHEREQNGN